MTGLPLLHIEQERAVQIKVARLTENTVTVEMPRMIDYIGRMADPVTTAEGQVRASRAAIGAPTFTRAHPWLFCAAMVVVFFAAILPVLPLREFSGGMENFNVATALEATRDGHWLTPTLNGEDRFHKPPLAQWVAAWGILAGGPLEIAARWPSLLMACLGLAAVFGLGRILGGDRLGAIAALVCGSTLLFLRYACQSIYDTQFALWVVLANLFLATIVFEGKWWRGCLGAGAAIGLALMTKGPIVLIQTLLPVFLFVAWQRWKPLTPAGRSATPPRSIVWPILAGLGLMLLIALPWTIYAFVKKPDLFTFWWNEVRLGDEARSKALHGRNNPFVVLLYLTQIPVLFPWIVWFLAGLGSMWRGSLTVSRSSLRLALLWLVVPLVIMSFFPERRDRYILPMLPAVAIIAAAQVLAFLDDPTMPARVRSALRLLHWLPLALACIGLPIAGWLFLRRDEGGPWYSPSMAIMLAGAMAMLVALTWIVQRRRAAALVPATVVLMLSLNFIFALGYQFSENHHSRGNDFARQIIARFPNAEAWHTRSFPRMPPLEITIYLDRPIRRIASPDLIAVGDRPQILLLMGDGRTEPQVPRFTKIAEGNVKGDPWYALLLTDSEP